MKRNFNSLEDVEKTFKSWDLNGDGAISFTELQVFFIFEFLKEKFVKNYNNFSLLSTKAARDSVKRR